MAFEWPNSMQLLTKQRVASILWTLQQNGGEVTDESGLATAKLNDLCREAKVRAVPKTVPGTYAGLLSNMAGERDGSPWQKDALIERDVNGKRTFAIRLLLEDEDMPPAELAWAPAVMPVAVAEMIGLVPEGSSSKPEPETEREIEPEPVADEVGDIPEVTVEPETVMIDTPTSTEVAVRAETPAALRKVLAISKLATDLMIDLSELSQRTDDVALGHLADALEENQRLREQVRQLQAAVEAKSGEITALRKSLTLTGANLERLRTSVTSNGHVQHDPHREIARLMQEPPTARP